MTEINFLEKYDKAEILNRVIALVTEKLPPIGPPEHPRNRRTLIIFTSEEQARDFFSKHPEIRAKIELFYSNDIVDKTLQLPTDESEE